MRRDLPSRFESRVISVDTTLTTHDVNVGGLFIAEASGITVTLPSPQQAIDGAESLLVNNDDNGNPLTDRGSEVVTKRYPGVDTSGQALSLGVDVKEVLVHIEGNTEIARFTGTASGSQQVRITQDGLTLEDVRVVKEPDEIIVTVAAPSGTIDVSLIGWR
ncbi:MAG: hypothetical protein P8182_20540 [Deltaproteobacteria bacterium]